MLTARIVVLNYNGEEILPKCIPSLIQAVKRSQYPVALTVLDNQSQDHSKKIMLENFPEVDYVEAPENLVLCSYNDYVFRMKEDIAILLNNDIRVATDFIDPLMKLFENNSKLFLVAPLVKSFDETEIEAARTKTGFRLGMFWATARYDGYLEEYLKPSETDSSGFGAFSVKGFAEMGGYDQRFLPGTLEDIDICYRAKNNGWQLLYEPKSVVYHMGQTSFKKKYGVNKTAILAQRNTFYFMWKNFSGLKFWLSHLFFLPARLVFALLTGRINFLMGFWYALVRKKI